MGVAAPCSGEAPRLITLEELAKHNRKEDGWIAVDGKVYDISEFITNHVGWECACGISTVLAIMRCLGTECSDEFRHIHTRAAYAQLAAFYIGELVETPAAALQQAAAPQQLALQCVGTVCTFNMAGNPSGGYRYKPLAALQLDTPAPSSGTPPSGPLSILEALQATPQPAVDSTAHGTNTSTAQAPNGAEASPEPSNHVSEDEGDLFISFDLDDAAPDVPSTSVPAQDTTVIVQPAEPPWARAAAAVDLDSHLLQLHNELVALYAYLTPTSEEHAARQRTVQRTTQVVQSIWPSSTVAVFGSFATGLYLPTSDIDLVVLGSDAAENLVNAQRALAAALARQGVGKNITVISRAKVPLVKFDDIASGVSVDISFDVANGPEAAAVTRDLMEQLPAMRPLVLLLKVFLQQRELNEVYSGGIGSYALMVLVAAFLLTHSSRWRGKHSHRSSNAGEQCLGVLLVDMLRLYGREFNSQDVGITLRYGGQFLPRYEMECGRDDPPSRWVVEDPNNKENNLAGGSYGIFKVRQALDFAYQVLTAPKLHPNEPLLSRVVRLDPIMYVRTPDSDPFRVVATATARDVNRHRDRHPDKHLEKKHHKSKKSKHRKSKRRRKRERDSSSSSPSEGSEDSGEWSHRRRARR